MKALICGLLSLALPLAVEVYPDSGRAEDTATPVSYSQLGGVPRLRQRMRRSVVPKHSHCRLPSVYMALVCIAWLSREYIAGIGKLRMVLPAFERCQLYGKTEG